MFSQQMPVLRRASLTAERGEGASYLWEVISSNQNTIGRSLQYLPHAIIEAQRGPVQRAVYLTPVQPGSAVKGREREREKKVR